MYMYTVSPSLYAIPLSEEIFLISSNLKSLLVKSPLITNTKQFREFLYEIENGKVRLSKSKAFAVPAALVGNKKTRDKIIDALVYDSEVNKQGRLYVNNWFIYCNFAGISSVVAENEMGARLDLSFVAQKAEWLRETIYKFSPDSGEATTGLNMPFNPPFDYSPQVKSIKKIENTAVADADFIFEFIGEVESIEFSIDNTSYIISSAVSKDESFYLNTYTKEVYKFRDNLKVDLFPFTSDDTYIFKQITSGEHTVSWAGDFPVKVTLLERRRFPKWT